MSNFPHPRTCLKASLKHFAFQTLPSALTAELHSAYACGAASHADAWLAEHFQKQNALNHFGKCAIAESGDVKATNRLGACRCVLSQHTCERDLDSPRKFAKNDQATELLDFCHIFRL
ncbi:hypothetical protein [Desulfocurvibacter africanus]|uniref:hypothetical protein n=1 Tax=Desulfocurvibacter africanus TaxID=873 RepID=UPI00110C4E0F|nr:hypothetical protein [Desulfocurvibacter africanus]